MISRICCVYRRREGSMRVCKGTDPCRKVLEDKLGWQSKSWCLVHTAYCNRIWASLSTELFLDLGVDGGKRLIPLKDDILGMIQPVSRGDSQSSRTLTWNKEWSESVDSPAVCPGSPECIQIVLLFDQMPMFYELPTCHSWQISWVNSLTDTWLNAQWYVYICTVAITYTTK